MNYSAYGQSVSSKIVVGLFFGKKDNIVLLHFYNLVSKADFNFIVKAILKHHLKNDFFKVHIYADLSSLLDADLSEHIESKTPQRNIVFTLEDGFLFDWIEDVPKAQRANKVKSILTECLLESVNILKNGEKKKEENSFSPFPFEQLQELMAYPDAFSKMQKLFNTNQSDTPIKQPPMNSTKPIVNLNGFQSLKGLGGGIASRGAEL